MCQLFGVCAKDSCELNQYLNRFFAHSTEHPHGWGLAFLENNEAQIEKEPIQASKSHYLKQRLSVPVWGKNVFAHIRYATIGNVEYRNCHPYTGKDAGGRRWTLVHNGTIFDYPPLNGYVELQKGDTDSERILLYLIHRIDEEEKRLERKMNEKERFQLLDRIIMEMSRENKLNLMIYDGELFYVHTNCAKSLYLLREEERVILSTVPLDEKDWQPVPFTTLLAYKQGDLVFTGTNHGNEYIENEENLKFLYSIFSDL